MKVAVLQSNYLPWKGYFHLINEVDLFCFYDEVQYTKNDWRNRNKIKTKNGVNWLTIPIPSSATKGTIKEAVITDQKWQTKHYQSLKSGYGKAPYFEQLDALANDYLNEKNWQKLSDLNQYIIIKIARMLGIKTKFVDSGDYELKDGRVSRLIGLLSSLGAKEYLSGPSAASYLKSESHSFEAAGVNLEYFQYPDYPAYNQLSEGFDNYVSIVDMIANISVDEIPTYIWNS